MQPHPPKGEKLRKSTKAQFKFPGPGRNLKETGETQGRKGSFHSWRGQNHEMNRRSSKKKVQPQELSREGSFSHYTPLPPIRNEDEKMEHQELLQVNGKRSLPKSAEKHYPSHQNDDALLNTIKRMRLGMDMLTADSPSSSSSLSFQEFQNDAVTVDQYIEPSKDYKIDLIFRLPKGSKIQATFKSTDTLETILKFLSKEMKVSLPLSKYVIYLNQVPKKELVELKFTLFRLGIKDRSCLLYTSPSPRDS